MRGRMPVNFQRLGIVVLQKSQVGVFLQWLREIDEIAVGLGHQRRIRQPRANRLRNIEGGTPLGNILHASIRKLHMNTVCHKVETCGWTESFSLLEGFQRVKRRGCYTDWRT